MIQVKLLSDTAKMPVKIDPKAVCWDLYADTIEVIDGALCYKLGIAVKPPAGYHLELYPRSSQAKTDWVFGNSVGIIDPEYTGELQVRMKPVSNTYIVPAQEYRNAFTAIQYNQEPDLPFQKGDRVAQMKLVKTETCDLVQVAELDETARGSNGFGSTGLK